jgi:hypothetical protein
MEASGHARWFERLLGELQHELWIGDAAEIRRIEGRHGNHSVVHKRLGCRNYPPFMARVE